MIKKVIGFNFNKKKLGFNEILHNYAKHLYKIVFNLFVRIGHLCPMKMNTTQTQIFSPKL